jgi:3-dehydroquinate synthase
MRNFRVELGPNSHSVHIGAGLLDRLGDLAREAGISPGRAAIVTDHNVARLYGARAKDSIAKAGFAVAMIEIPAGEASKSLASYERVIDAMVEARLDRQSAVFALGGGVVGDLAGFAASSYMRGIPIVQAPTSVVGQVDSALGGKTGIDHRRAKNLVGAFYQPRLIVADIATLGSLPEREFREGLAEAIKYGAIMDAPMFSAIENDLPAILSRDPAKLEELVDRSLRCKAAIVSQDEREGDLRKILNFGHTVGHAIEAAGDYARYLHGEAVAIGMAVASRLSCLHAGLAESDQRRLVRLIERAGLPTEMPDLAILPDVERERFSSALKLDKKRAGEAIDFVLVPELGRAIVKKLSFEQITAAIQSA